MSQQPHPLRYGAAASRPRPAARPSLRVVAPPRRRAGRLPFVIFCSVLMTLGLGTLLALNLSLVSGSYVLHDLSARAESVRAQEAELTEKVALQATSTNLAERAAELGMVAAGTPAYLRLSDGAVIGNPTPASTPDSPTDTAPEPGVGETATGGTAGSSVEPTEEGTTVDGTEQGTGTASSEAGGQSSGASTGGATGTSAGTDATAP